VNAVLLLALMMQGPAPRAPAWCAAPETLVSPAPFVECARAGTERYKDRSRAVQDGYRRIGRDFPGMGEHWIRISRVFDGEFDAARPEVLNYVDIKGTPILVGVGYALPLLPGERAPRGPAGEEAWHDHFRTVEEETLLPHHHTHGTTTVSARIAMMHAWIWSANPDGVFAADNWLIPFERLHLTAPSKFSIPAAKALSLVAGGRDYIEASIHAAGASSPAERLAVKVALDRAQEDVNSTVGANDAPSLTSAAIEALKETWAAMWRTIDTAVRPEIREKLASLPTR
jgi:hypothetical protein